MFDIELRAETARTIPEATLAADLIAELTELTALPGPAGAEEPVALWLRSRLGELAGSPESDPLGNLILRAPGRPRVCVTAHMDQVGYMVSRVHAEHADCLPLGQPNLPSGKEADIRAVGPDHPPLDGKVQARGDKGARLRSKHLEHIRVGDRVLFAEPLDVRDDGRVCGPALDDRIGCLIALNAARTLASHQSGIAFAWTVREETEQAGVIRVARDLQPELLVAVDITYATGPDQSEESPISIGAGPAMTLLDGGMVAHDPLVRTFDEAAGTLGITWQREVVFDGISEAGRVQRTLGIPALALLVPIEHPHSPGEVASVEDIQGASDLLVAGVRALLAEPTSSTLLIAAGP